MFKVVDTIAHKKSETVLPDHSLSEELANHFGVFFAEEVYFLQKRYNSYGIILPLLAQITMYLSTMMTVTLHHHWTHSSLPLLMK